MPDPGHLTRARNAQRNAVDALNAGDNDRAHFWALQGVTAAMSAAIEAMERMTPPRGDVACPHWSPGRITMRTGCTACEAERREVRYGEKRVILRRADELLEGVMYCTSPADEPPVIEIDGMQTLAQSIWLARGWSILDWKAGS